MYQDKIAITRLFKGRIIRKLMGGGGGRSTKKNSRKGLIQKNSCTPINPKKYSCKGLKKNSYKEFDKEKNSCGSKIPLPPPPPITFLMVRP